MNIIFRQEKTLHIVPLMKVKKENTLHFPCEKYTISIHESKMAGEVQQKNRVEENYGLILENTCIHGQSAYNFKGTRE